jgi:hypothetical protein
MSIECEDCGDETAPGERRKRCHHCSLMVCRWCWHHVHRCEPNHTAAECRDRAPKPSAALAAATTTPKESL